MENMVLSTFLLYWFRFRPFSWEVFWGVRIVTWLVSFLNGLQQVSKCLTSSGIMTKNGQCSSLKE